MLSSFWLHPDGGVVKVITTHRDAVESVGEALASGWIRVYLEEGPGFWGLQVQSLKNEHTLRMIEDFLYDNPLHPHSDTIALVEVNEEPFPVAVWLSKKDAEQIGVKEALLAGYRIELVRAKRSQRGIQLS